MTCKLRMRKTRQPKRPMIFRRSEPNKLHARATSESADGAGQTTNGAPHKRRNPSARTEPRRRQQAQTGATTAGGRTSAEQSDARPVQQAPPPDRAQQHQQQTHRPEQASPPQPQAGTRTLMASTRTRRKSPAKNRRRTVNQIDNHDQRSREESRGRFFIATPRFARRSAQRP